MAAAVRNLVSLFTFNKEWGWPQKPAVRRDYSSVSPVWVNRRIP